MDLLIITCGVASAAGVTFLILDASASQYRWRQAMEEKSMMRKELAMEKKTSDGGNGEGKVVSIAPYREELEQLRAENKQLREKLALLSGGMPDFSGMNCKCRFCGCFRRGDVDKDGTEAQPYGGWTVAATFEPERSGAFWALLGMRRPARMRRCCTACEAVWYELPLFEKGSGQPKKGRSQS